MNSPVPNPIRGIIAQYEVLFATAFRRWYPQLVAFAKKLRLGVDAEEVVQDMFTGIWFDPDGPKKLAKHDEGEKGYLFGAVRNQVMSRRRARDVHDRYVARERARPERGMVMSSAERWLDEEDLERLKPRVIASLPTECRAVFLLRHEDGLQPEKIAERLGIAVSTVYVQWARAKVKFYAAFKAAGYDV